MQIYLKTKNKTKLIKHSTEIANTLNKAKMENLKNVTQFKILN